MTTERKAPAEIEDVKELRREIRIAMMNNDDARRDALEARYQQWRHDHADQIEAAQQPRKARDAELIRRHEVQARMVGRNFEFACEMTQIQHDRINERNRAFAKSEEARRERERRESAEQETKAKAEHIQNLNRENKKLRGKTK